MDAKRWHAVSAYLDAALDLSDGERTAWLARLRAQEPHLAAEVQTLLEELRTITRDGFLEDPAPALPMPPALVGETFGAYTLVSSIGQGGMGSVWLAERSDGRFERRVAVKLLNPALMGRGGRERFQREGSLLGRLAHPHIADLVDAGVTATGQPYLVLEYVDGDPIDRFCDERRLDVAARVRLMLDVIDAVAHAHAHLIVHRDIKPSNVLVARDGQVKLLDFGIATLLEGDGQAAGAARLTREGQSAMTPAYAAPEQVRGGPVSTATDVYGLGVLLYLLLTGRHPAGSDLRSAADLVRAIVETEPARPSGVVLVRGAGAEDAVARADRRATTPERLHRLLRGDLDTIVAKALKKDPRERYASVSALGDDLRRSLGHEPIAARPDRLGYRTFKFLRRNRTAVALATVAATASLFGVLGVVIQEREARRQRDLALRQLLRSQTDRELLEFLLSDAGPSGKPFTVNQLLTRAEQVLARQHTDKATQVDLMNWIGNDYSSQDHDADALRLLEKAHTLSADLEDPALRAETDCALAFALARGDELDRAEALFQGAMRDLPEEPQFALARVGCLRTGSDVAMARGDTRESVVRAEAARRTLRSSPFDSDVSELRASMDLAEAYRGASQDHEAIAEFERAGALLTSVGRDETQTAVILFNNWALELEQVGRPLESANLLRRAIDISRADPTEAAVSPMVLNNYARILDALGRLDEAADYSERAYARGQETGHQLAIMQSLLTRARVYRERGDLTRAEAMLAEVEPRLTEALPPGHYAFASLTLERALLAEARGQHDRAGDLADHAVAMVEAAIQGGGEGAFFLPPLLLRRADIALAAQRPDGAAADAARALELLRATTPPGALSSSVGLADLALGRSLAAQGKPAEARAAFSAAVENLVSTLGPDHPETRRARQLAGS
jgi:eukaryotic-like serine/threonine-protein kinase